MRSIKGDFTLFKRTLVAYTLHLKALKILNCYVEVWIVFFSAVKILNFKESLHIGLCCRLLCTVGKQWHYNIGHRNAIVQ